ncbi:ankyrin repeat domain-containing protein 7-like [Heliangelus exortis]|uniref:ankyrin repeat domain-containing protein 7-like n=1 Tax=Heliangelus exortis TaxID=472823 RepID=UPI003A8D81A4
MGADVHARDQQQRTPLMMAASVGKMKLIQVLLHYGADISHKDADGRTADDYACIYGYPSLSEQLSESAAPKKAEAARAGDIKLSWDQTPTSFSEVLKSSLSLRGHITLKES